jgi:hypothetical protein
MSKCPVCGKDDVNIFRGEACLACRIGAYLDTLNALVRRARILTDDDPDIPHHSFFQKLGSVREACIQLYGGRIDFIELWRTDLRFVTWFTIAYLIKAIKKYDKRDLTASLGEPFSAFHERIPLKEYKWKGGLLAQILSSDMTLQRALMPNKSQIEIIIESRNNLVAITEVVGDSYPDPELEHIEAIESIIDHVRELPPRIS